MTKLTKDTEKLYQAVGIKNLTIALMKFMFQKHRNEVTWDELKEIEAKEIEKLKL